MTLAVEWVRCASSLAQLSSTSGEQLERITALGSIALDGSESEPAAVLTLSANIADASRSIDVPVFASPSAMARIWTGTVRRECDRVEVAVPIAAAGIEITIRLSSNHSARRETGSQTRMIHPRWITDERLRKATVAYAIEDGVVCARLHARASSSAVTAALSCTIDGRDQSHPSCRLEKVERSLGIKAALSRRERCLPTSCTGALQTMK
jgi:hypothetical protein